MIAAVAGLLLPIGAAWLALRAVGPRAGTMSGPFTAALAACLGIGLSSLTALWWALAFGGVGAAYAVVDGLLWAAVAALAWRRLRRTRAGAPADRTPLRAHVRPIAGVFVLLAGVAAAIAVAEYRAAPIGHPDATLIWNLKARFLYRGGDGWGAFVAVPWSNPSHPLLVPASVARLWAYAGHELPLAPVFLGVAAAAGIAAALIGTLGSARARAWVAASVLIAPWTFADAIVAQTADLPFALLAVVALVCCFQLGARVLDAAWHAGVAGLLAALLVWTKNEGAVLFVLASTVALSVAWSQRRGSVLVAFSAGAAPALATAMWLKLVFAPVPPEYFSAASVADLPAMLEPERLAMVASLAWHHWLRWGAAGAAGLLPIVTLLAATVAFMPSGYVARRLLTAVAVMLASYVVVWVLSPLDTTWLVSTTADRLLLQIWPAVVLAAFSWEAPLRGLAAASNLER